MQISPTIISFLARELRKAPPKFSTEFSAHCDCPIDLLKAAWEDCCSTVERLSYDVGQLWLGAITAMHSYDGGLRVDYRSSQDQAMFAAVILGAWERANGSIFSLEIRDTIMTPGAMSDIRAKSVMV
ncbi:MAG: hypothetical protein ABW039_04875 [Sphingobium sp.]